MKLPIRINDTGNTVDADGQLIDAADMPAIIRAVNYHEPFIDCIQQFITASVVADNGYETKRTRTRALALLAEVRGK